MELPEPIDWINRRLQDEYGYQDLTRPYWRIVFSENQFEKRYGTYRDSVNGVLLREVTEVREVPKYRQWIQEKWVLERLTVVPTINSVELLGEQLSYEPVWVFEDGRGKAQAPLFRSAKFVVEQVYQQAARAVGKETRYKDPDDKPDEALANKEARLDKLQLELFGNETEIGTALSHKTGIVVPGQVE